MATRKRAVAKSEERRIVSLTAFEDRRYTLPGVSIYVNKEFDDVTIFNCMNSLMTSAMAMAKLYMSKAIEEKAKLAVASGELKTAEGKQTFLRGISDLLKRYEATVLHPDTGLPCLLLVINDKYGGKFSLETKLTKKRSHTTRDILDLMPLKLGDSHYPPDASGGQGWGHGWTAV